MESRKYNLNDYSGQNERLKGFGTLTSLSKDGKARAEIASNVEIRELRKRDLFSIRNILTSNIVQAPLTTEEGDSQYREMAYYFMKMSDSLEAGNDRQYSVATIRNHVVGVFGFMSLGHKTAEAVHNSGSFLPVEPTAELVNFYVDPEHQQKGIGTKLWNHVHESIVNQGFESIAFLSTDRHSEMWPWYEKHGYTPIGEGEHFKHPCRFFYKVAHAQLPANLANSTAL